MIRVALFDLDGVIRHFDSTQSSDIELRHGIVAGTIAAIAFAEPLIGHVTSGRISRAEWVRRVGELAGSVQAAEEWGRQPAALDEGVLELADEIRAVGLTAAVLTNGTDTIATEVVTLGLTNRFDAIFNSADIGFVKPDVRAFQHVLNALGVSGPEVFYTDDSASKLAGAGALSMRTHLFKTVADLRGALRATGVSVRRAAP